MKQTKWEKKFLHRLLQQPDKCILANIDSPMEGFEYFDSTEYKSEENIAPHRLKAMLSENTLLEVLNLGQTFIRVLPSILKNIKRNFLDVEELLFSPAPVLTSNRLESFTNNSERVLWNEIKNYAWEKYRLTVGFTKVPREYIFMGKAIPFEYALIFAQEMDKESIEKAPKLDAGEEVIKVYNTLGIAVNDIAKWLRKKYGIKCMANHPLGGLVDTVPLAEKAALGVIGRSGMLITEEFGSRCRIAPIFLKEQIFAYTDSDKHQWVKNFCANCGKCKKSCPMSAIYQEPKLISQENRESRKRYQCQDKVKCYSFFSATMGCGICIAVCPFAKNPTIYGKMKPKYSEK